MVEANGRNQGCPFRDDSPLLGNLPLEPVELRAIGGQRRIGVSNVRGEDVYGPVPRVSKNRINPNPRITLQRLAEEGDGVRSATDELENRAFEFVKCQLRNWLQRARAGHCAGRES